MFPIRQPFAESPCLGVLPWRNGTLEADLGEAVEALPARQETGNIRDLPWSRPKSTSLYTTAFMLAVDEQGCPVTTGQVTCQWRIANP